MKLVLGILFLMFVAAFPFESLPSTLYVPAGTPVSVLLDVLKDWPLEIAKFNSS